MEAHSNKWSLVMNLITQSVSKLINSLQEVSVLCLGFFSFIQQTTLTPSNTAQVYLKSSCAFTSMLHV